MFYLSEYNLGDSSKMKVIKVLFGIRFKKILHMNIQPWEHILKHKTPVTHPKGTKKTLDIKRLLTVDHGIPTLKTIWWDSCIMHKQYGCDFAKCDETTSQGESLDNPDKKKGYVSLCSSLHSPWGAEAEGGILKTQGTFSVSVFCQLPIDPQSTQRSTFLSDRNVWYFPH